jgi:hypothetical protein
VFFQTIKGYTVSNVEVPTLIIELKADWKALLLAYGASTTTTLLPTLQYLLNPSIVSPPLTTSELAALLSSYTPFLLIPLTITLDMGFRLYAIIGRDQAKKRV